jgi:hypothetical protein
MDGYQFIAALVQSVVSLAWPLAFVAAVWMFRDKIVELLPLLRVKYKELDVNFRINQAQKEADALEEPESLPKPTPEEIDKYRELARISPRSAILERSYQLEEAVRAFAVAVGLPSTQRYPQIKIIRELRNHKLIDEATSALLSDLGSVRNTAAHGSDIELSEEVALKFGELANKLIAQLQFSTEAAKMQDPAQLP